MFHHTKYADMMERCRARRILYVRVGFLAKAFLVRYKKARHKAGLFYVAVGQGLASLRSLVSAGCARSGSNGVLIQIYPSTIQKSPA